MKQRAGGGRLGRWCDCSSQTSVLPGLGGGSLLLVLMASVVVVHLIGPDSVVLQQLDEQQAAGDQRSGRCLLNFTGSVQCVRVEKSP